MRTRIYFQVPYREPVEGKIGVVACFSPLFYYERWQLIIATLEIYRQFGVGVQTYYIQSMVAEVFEFLKVYERRGLVDIQTWANIVLGDQGLDYNPNEELEWRNQASAHTDCLLKYKVFSARLRSRISDDSSAFRPVAQ
ncbi:Protein F59C6.8 [Aphelenchoides avenae]|nr:Protein F59C6.8 [Aphelenchus avenae]